MDPEQFRKFCTQNLVVHATSLSAGDLETDSGKILASVDQTDKKAKPPEHLLTNGSDLLPVLLRGLSKIEKIIVILYVHEERTMKEIGTEVGLSESRVSQLFTNSLIPALLRNSLSIPDWDSERHREWVTDFLRSRSAAESTVQTEFLSRLQEAFKMSFGDHSALQFTVVEELPDQRVIEAPAVPGVASATESPNLSLSAAAFSFNWNDTPPTDLQ